jgi:hypothetical protein
MPFMPMSEENCNNGMAGIYRQADKVLVIDNFLQYQTGKLSLVEMGTRVKYSPWISRIWTLQEGRLARELLFQFDNIAIPADDLLESIKGSRNIKAVSDILDRLGEHHILGNPSAMRLVRALALYKPELRILSYAKLPPQKDPEIEELRLSALEVLNDFDEHRLQKKWSNFLSKSGNVEIESKAVWNDIFFEADEFLIADIQVGTTLCTVTSNSLSAIKQYQRLGLFFKLARRLSTVCGENNEWIRG